MSINILQNRQNQQQQKQNKPSIKQNIYQTLHCLLRSNQCLHNIFYYILLIIQSLQIFYYITHPIYPFYQQSQIIHTIHKLLKYLVFNQFILQYPQIYKIILPICSVYFLLQITLFIIILNDIKQNQQIMNINKIHQILNIMFLLTNHIFTIPFIGISINTIYCNNSNFYTKIISQQGICYSGEHIMYCILAVFVFLMLVIECVIYWYIYYDKNPFSMNFLAKYDNNNILGKFLIKILPLIYIAIDSNMKLINVFTFGLVGLLCGYIFFFRLFSYHDYNQFNFYFAYFLQICVTWFSINNLILYYLDTQHKAGGIIECFMCAILISILMQQLQQQSYKRIFYESIQNQIIKKQNIQKYLYRLIYMFIHSQSNQQKNQLTTLIKIVKSKKLSQQSQQSQQKQKQQIDYQDKIQTKNNNNLSNKIIIKNFYKFIKNILTQYTQLNSNIMLMIINCNILIYESKYSYAFHQSLQISNKKINISQQLIMYRFRRNNRYDKQKLNMNKKQNNNIFLRYFDFNKYLMKLQQLINYCTLNNLDYWQQICQINPSIYKIRNLAEKYQQYQQKINQYNKKIFQIFPNNKYAIKCYIEYLLHVGINIKNLSKSIERFNQAQENIKKSLEKYKNINNLIQMGENQNIAYISIQTNQNNLGNIKNCNSQFKNILGYEKYQLIDKKVNKIMPKSFSQFHDNIIRNYIQKKQLNQKNKVQRVVYALNKQNYLTQVVLFTKVNYKNVGQKPGLQLIGFIKKLQNPKKSVILVQLNTHTIIGVNQAFSKLIQNGMNTLQYGTNQIKVTSILPQLDMNKIQSGQSQQTTLLFSSTVIVTRSGLNLQIKKKVLVQIQQIKQYSSKQKLAYLIIRAAINNNKFNIKNNKQNNNNCNNGYQQFYNNKQQQRIKSRQIRKKQQRQKQRQKSQVSIMSLKSFDTLLIVQKQDLINQQQNYKQQQKQTQNHLNIQRKKQQFLKNQKIGIFKYILNIISILFSLLTIGIFIYIYILNYSRQIQSKQLKQQIKQIDRISYLIGRINKNYQKLMKIQLYNNQTQFIQFNQQLTNSTYQFQNNLIKLITKSSQYTYPLQLNQFRFYNITIGNNILTNQSQLISQKIIDAFFQYISSSKNIIIKTYTELLNIQIIQQMQQINYFIQSNGKKLFPSITQNMKNQYLNLDQYLYNQHSKLEFIINIVYIIFMLFTLFVIALLIKKINIFNQNVINIYNDIKLWDANQMKTKCINFLQKKSLNIMKNNNQKKKYNSLLNIFPQDIFVKVIDKPTTNNQKKVTFGNKNNKKAKNENNPFSNKKILSKKNLSFNQDQKQLFKQNTPSVMPLLQEQQSKSLTNSTVNVIQKPIQRRNKYYVSLKQKNKLKKKFIIFSLATLVFIVLFFLKNNFLQQFQLNALNINRKISQLGRVRKNLAFMNYYTYQLMLNPQDQVYRQQLKKQILQFYSNTDLCYQLIGDPSKILKSSYNVVQQISALIFSQNLTTITYTNISDRYSIKNQKYLLQQSSFNNNIKQITQKINIELQKKTQIIYNNIILFNIICGFGLFFIISIFAFVIKCCMLEEILRNSNKSKSMIMMLPPWLIIRNKGLEMFLQ